MADADTSAQLETELQGACAGRFRAAVLVAIIACVTLPFLPPGGNPTPSFAATPTPVIAALLVIVALSFGGWGRAHLWVVTWLGGAAIGAGFIWMTAGSGGTGPEGLTLLLCSMGWLAPMPSWPLAALYGLHLAAYNGVQLAGEGGEPVWQLARHDAVLICGAAVGLLSGISLRRACRAELTGSAELRRIRATDPLTQLLSRRSFAARLDGELLRAQRTGTPLCLMMLDVDRFAQINDHNGRAVGDAVLRRIGGIIAATLRRTDLAGRYGGEELAICLTDTKVDGALELADRLRRTVSAAVIEAPNGDLTTTISIGVAQLREAHGSVADLVRAADEALYQAKRRGRNRVVTAVVA